MENYKKTFCTTLIIALFFTAAYLDKQGCKTPAEAIDILGGGKIKRLERENAVLRQKLRMLSEQLVETQSELARIEQKQNNYNVSERRKFSDSNVQPSLMPINRPLNSVSDTNSSIKYASNTASYKKYNRSKSLHKIPSHSIYQRKIYPIFENICADWRKSFDLQDGDRISIIIKINRDGRIIWKGVESSNVSVASERYLLDRISKIGSLDPLPNDYEKPILEQRVTFQKNIFGLGTVNRRRNSY